jgi:dienelactone hydrolase
MSARDGRASRKAERILAVMGAARDVAGGVRYDLELVDGTERVPAIMLVPHAHEPVPAALLLHGFGSEKERMAHSVGFALMTRGVCALAVDLPMHGARSEGAATLSMSNPLQIVSTWKRALREARFALEYLESHEAVDAERIGLVGYSLGSFLANIVAANSPSVRATVLAASGDLPEGLPFESLVRAVVDPLRAVRRVAGRPLLMVNGRFDRTVKPAQAERLFAAAQEPKTMRWYGGGHWPPPKEINYAAEWLMQALTSDRSLKRRNA